MKNLIIVAVFCIIASCKSPSPASDASSDIVAVVEEDNLSVVDASVVVEDATVTTCAR